MKAQFYVNGKKVTIEASMDTLNELEGMAMHTSDYCNGKAAKKVYEGAADYYNEWVNGIHDALDAKGYYDDVK